MFNITLDTLEEINIVLAALGELPLKSSMPVWQKIKAQAEEQLKEQEQLKEKE